VLEWARRVGKTWLLCVIAVCVCLRKKKARVVYGAPTIKDLAEFIIPTIEAICEDAPADCRPTWNEKTGHWVFPNGSYIHLFGCDDKRKANRGRGSAADLVVVDECGFIPILGYVLRSVLRPQTMTTGARTILGSTPSDEPDHDFTAICEQAEVTGNYSHRTIYDNPRLTQERIEEYVAEDAKDEGLSVEEYKKTDVYQREYLARRVVDRTLIVMGDDWTATRETARVEVPQPQFWDAYQAFDMGGVDPHGILFGWWDFAKTTLVIEDELLFRDNETTEEIATAWKAKEVELYGAARWDGSLKALHCERTDPTILQRLPDYARDRIERSETAPEQPYLRVCDNDIQIAKDMSILHGITCLPTEKTDKRFYVNEFRILMRKGQVKVHPRCRNLDRHLRQTIWANERQTDYRRKNGEHGDLLDCAVYMSRNVRRQRNPVPENYGLDEATQWVRRQREKPRDGFRALAAKARRWK
jgi:hypothetical protein